MAKWKSCKRRDFIKKLKRIGFAPPESGGNHSYMRHGTYTFTVPSNSEEHNGQSNKKPSSPLKRFAGAWFGGQLDREDQGNYEVREELS